MSVYFSDGFLKVWIRVALFLDWSKYMPRCCENAYSARVDFFVVNPVCHENFILWRTIAHFACWETVEKLVQVQGIALFFGLRCLLQRDSNPSCKIRKRDLVLRVNLCASKFVSLRDNECDILHSIRHFVAKSMSFEPRHMLVRTMMHDFPELWWLCACAGSQW